jgi:murein DD-endopeptidase MepM/ murein hydrolase activator NlpD
MAKSAGLMRLCRAVAIVLVAGCANSQADAAATSDDLSVLASELIIPVKGVVVSQLRDSYMDALTGHAHEALDIMAPRGTPVISAANGRLLKLFKSVAGGNMVYAADTSDRFILMYGHLDRYARRTCTLLLRAGTRASHGGRAKRSARFPCSCGNPIPVSPAARTGR